MYILQILKLRLESGPPSLDFSSLPVLTSYLPSPSKCVDDTIIKLIKDSKQPPVKPFENLNSCLSVLKDEMLCLRETVMKNAS